MVAEELEDTLIDGDDEEEGSKKKSLTFMLVVIIGGVLVLGVLGYLSYILFFAEPEESKSVNGDGIEQVDESENGLALSSNDTQGGEGAPEPIIYPMDPFIVNLNDPTGSRYLKVKLSLDLATPELLAEVESKIAQLRDSILILLSSKSFADISSVEGKLKLRNELIHRINQVMIRGRLSTLYFTEFVIQ